MVTYLVFVTLFQEVTLLNLRVRWILDPATAWLWRDLSFLTLKWHLRTSPLVLSAIEFSL